MKLRVAVAALSALALLACGSDQTAPPQAKRVFYTLNVWTGDLKTAGGGATGLEGADNLCNLSARAAGFGGTWKAWLSSSTQHAVDRIADVGPWERYDGTVVFNNKAALSLSPGTPVLQTETGGKTCAGCQRPWTGTRLGGTAALENCRDWTSASPDDRGMNGDASAGGTTWTEYVALRCSDKFQLYCLEQ